MTYVFTYLWQPWEINPNAFSEMAIATSFGLILFILIYIRKKRKDNSLSSILLLVTVLILVFELEYAAGLNIGQPADDLLNWLKPLTACLAWAMAIALALKTPQIISLASPVQIGEIKQQLADKNAELSQPEAISSQQEKLLRNIYDDVQEAIFIVNVNKSGEF